jgi:hypothetical protein
MLRRNSHATLQITAKQEPSPSPQATKSSPDTQKPLPPKALPQHQPSQSPASHTPARPHHSPQGKPGYRVPYISIPHCTHIEAIPFRRQSGETAMYLRTACGLPPIQWLRLSMMGWLNFRALCLSGPSGSQETPRRCGAGRYCSGVRSRSYVNHSAQAVISVSPVFGSVCTHLIAQCRDDSFA